MALKATLARANILKRLERNRNRRGEAAGEHEAARSELAELIRAGRKQDPPVPMTKMCAAAGINRGRAYELLEGKERAPRGLFHDEGGTA